MCLSTRKAKVDIGSATVEGDDVTVTALALTEKIAGPDDDELDDNALEERSTPT